MAINANEYYRVDDGAELLKEGWRSAISRWSTKSLSRFLHILTVIKHYVLMIYISITVVYFSTASAEQSNKDN